MAVVFVVGVLAAMAATRHGQGAVAVADAEGVARRIAWGLSMARRQAISEGTPAALVFDRASGAVSGWRVVRASAGGDVLVDEVAVVPRAVQVTAPADRWEFDYTGALTTPPSGGSVVVAAGKWTGTLAVYAATGACRVTNVYSP